MAANNTTIMGIFDKIKSAFGGGESQPSGKPAAKEDNNSYESIIDAAHKELLAGNNTYWWNIKPAALEAYKNWLLVLDDKKKVGFLIWAVMKISRFHQTAGTYSSNDIDYQLQQLAEVFQSSLLRTKIILDEDDVEQLLHTYSTQSRYSSHNLMHWPVNLVLSQVEKQFGGQQLSPRMINMLRQLLTDIQNVSENHQQKDKLKILQKIEVLLHSSSGNAAAVMPVYFPARDEFGLYANNYIDQMDETAKQVFFKIMLHAQKATAGKPSAKYLNEVQLLYKEFGADKYKAIANDWMLFIASMKEKVETHTQQYGDRTYNYSTIEFIAAVNTDMIKGFIWSLVHFFDRTTLFNIAQLADRAYRKIPQKGPANAAIGNACLYVLANVKGMDGIGHLSRLRLRIKQASTQAIIEKYLDAAAKEQGISLHEIEDLAVDDFDLTGCKRIYELEGYKAELQLTGIGKTHVQWYKPDGAEQKAVPAAVKEKQAAKLKKIKETAKLIELTTTAQRDRLDRMFISNRSIKAADFIAHYFEHGLMQYLASRIIWNVQQQGIATAVFYLNGQWVNNRSEPVAVDFTEDVTVSLWHPVFSTVEEIKNWREFMLQHKVVQPLKQAYREVYLLTDAEVNTKSYSNRMAAHILKQHQFNSLAKTRGWSYALQGGWDGGDNGIATRILKEYNLRAEYWVDAVDSPDAMNDTGIWLYMSTDQVRFCDSVTNEIKDLIDIPAIVFSEVMRDVDLFVGVASVGNDPNWRDSGGLPAYRTYWESYSFGDLNEVAKTRKTILENLLPRLKIASVSHLQDKFLVVKGKLRTYKIHIGSTNILMEPNDQYLCIVPDRSNRETSDNMFLPFEGDNGLSVILSKAVLLSEDDKITDPTITSQINRK